MESLLSGSVAATVLVAAILTCVNSPLASMDVLPGEGWIALFNEETLEGWKANESPETWSVKDEAIAVKGPVSHLFYTGPG